MDDSVKLYNEDCLEVLKTLPDGCVDAIVTDPPYGIEYDHGNQSAGGRSANQVKWGSIAGDGEVGGPWLAEAFRVLRTGGAMYLSCRWDVEPEWRKCVVGAGFILKQRLTWHKRVNGKGDLRGTYQPTCEDVLFATKGRHILSRRPSMLLDVGCVPTWEIRYHPHQKPESLPKLLIEVSTRIGGTVLDPFMGSGTTGIASVNLNRRFIGVELSGEHFATAERRIAEARQKAVPLAEAA